MKNVFTLSCFLLLSYYCFGQSERYLSSDEESNGLPFLIQLPIQNNEQLKQEEMAARQPGRAPKFAQNIRVEISPQTHGRWMQIAPNKLSWQCKIYSKDALSLNLGFTYFSLPEGSSFLIYGKDKKEVYGPFTPADNDDHMAFWTPAIPGDELLLQVELPTKEKDNLGLDLGFVNHDFMGLGRIMSGSCNLDVVCNADDGWEEVENYRDVIQSVGLITVNGNTLCSGFLVNNARQDCTPYFITADHCELTRNQARSMVVYWNYQNSYCRQPNSFPSGQEGDGLRTIFNSGAIYLANNETSDFTLVRLDDPVVEEANAYFAGWDIGNTPILDGGVCVHHPTSQEKRISFTDREIYTGRWGQGSQRDPNGDHLVVQEWSIGTTEDGSSGAPLFNRNGQVIGQLHGGLAACGNRQFDAFGWFRSSWSKGSSASSRLKDWLDPNDSGLTSINGRWAIQCEISIVADKSFKRDCLPSNSSFELSISEAFSGPVSLSIASLPPELEASFSTEVAQAGSLVNLNISSNSNTPSGEYSIVIRGADNRDTVLTTLILNLESTPDAFNLLSPDTKNKEFSTSPRLIWQRSNKAEFYDLIVSKDPLFSEISIKERLTDTVFQVQNLDFETEYFWKVEANNDCGITVSSNSGNFITAPDINLSLISPQFKWCPDDIIQLEVELGSGFREASALQIRLLPNVEGLVFSYDRDPNELEGQDKIKIDIDPQGLLSEGLYVLEILVEDDTRFGEVILEIEIDAPPSAFALLQPSNMAYILQSDVHFNWELNGLVEDFQIEIATDENFQNIRSTELISNNTFHEQLPSGQYFWRVKAQNRCGTLSSMPQQFNVRVDNLSGFYDKKLAIEPNPTNNQINVYFSEPLEDATIEIMEINGQLLEKHPVAAESTQWRHDLSSYPAGVYILRVKEKRRSISKRIVVQR